ncbi:carbon storage regulator CsrA [Niallia sp. NCCP-28]|uniref:carbon storage regulator CsrA n=1 Tax=Niallia sp. NCCP-28 TaxID=2934712 RepID=UPI00208B9449|nr:carbon storage regulator CsrA [Niallia sp. NCCP-28]GKU83398.1 carbon storage regulator [Niallia sp. NCCP-28]
MLVLSRKNGEVIKIGEDIEITVIASKGDQVKIGISAPKDIEIFRKEVYEQIMQENRTASADISTFLNLFKKNEKKS